MGVQDWSAVPGLSLGDLLSTHTMCWVSTPQLARIVSQRQNYRIHKAKPVHLGTFPEPWTSVGQVFVLILMTLLPSCWDPRPGWHFHRGGSRAKFRRPLMWVTSCCLVPSLFSTFGALSDSVLKSWLCALLNELAWPLVPVSQMQGAVQWSPVTLP